MARAESTGSSAVWAVVVLVLVGVIVWLLVAGPLGGGGGGTPDRIDVNVDIPAAPGGGGQ
jgi:hypothetical protein